VVKVVVLPPAPPPAAEDGPGNFSFVKHAMGSAAITPINTAA
jgi:hypothetical protein